MSYWIIRDLQGNAVQISDGIHHVFAGTGEWVVFKSSLDDLPLKTIFYKFWPSGNPNLNHKFITHRAERITKEQYETYNEFGMFDEQTG